MKQCLASIIIKEMKTKTTRYHFSVIRVVKRKILRTQCWHMEKQKRNAYITEEQVNYC